MLGIILYTYSPDASWASLDTIWYHNMRVCVCVYMCVCVCMCMYVSGVCECV